MQTDSRHCSQCELDGRGLMSERKRQLPNWTTVKRRGWDRYLVPKTRNYVLQGFCAWCGNRIGGRRTRFCCDACAQQYTLATIHRAGYGPYKRRILIRDNFTCRDCGKFMAMNNEWGVVVPAGSQRIDVHHIIPVSMGGGDEPTNLITLCPECHKKRHQHKNIK